MRFYAVAEDFGKNAEEAERVLDSIIYHASPDVKRFLEREARECDHLAGRVEPFTPIMDWLVQQAEDEIFRTWETRPSSGHSLRIAWEDEK